MLNLTRRCVVNLLPTSSWRAIRCAARFSTAHSLPSSQDVAIQWSHRLASPSGNPTTTANEIITAYKTSDVAGGVRRSEECFAVYIAALARVGGDVDGAIRERRQEHSLNSQQNNHSSFPSSPPLNQLYRSPNQLTMPPLQQQHPMLVQLWKSRFERNFDKIRTILNVIISGCVIYFLYTRLLSSSGSLLSGPGGVYQPSKDPKKQTKFEDVQGADEAKSELEELVDFLKHPQRYSTLGGKVSKGILLSGPPGTGKTMLARAVAGEAGVPFFYASGSEFEEMFVGLGAARIRALFRSAREAAPAIVFIDELDAIGAARQGRDSSHTKQSLNQLLTELDGFDQSDGIIVMASTNLPESLDKALVRPGRFDRIVTVPLPDVRGRIAIIKTYLSKIIAHADIDAQTIARGTPGFSGAQLENLVNQAAVRASKLRSPSVTQEHFEWAKDKLLMGALRASAFITPESKRSTAFHEAGHALVNIYTPGAIPLHKVSCMPRGHALGITTMLPEMDKNSETYEQSLAHIDVAMGGRAAEELIYGKRSVTTGGSNDISKATQIASHMVKDCGFSDAIGPVSYPDDAIISHTKRAEIDAEIKDLLQQGANRATEILKTHKSELIKLADALVEYEELSAEEVRKIIKGQRIRR